MKVKALVVLFLTALFGSVPAVAASIQQSERAYYQKGNVTLVVMLARDNCCNYEGIVGAAGWVPTRAPSKGAKLTCYLTISEVDIALACYRKNEKGRIGTRVIDIDSKEACPTRMFGLLAGAGVDNILQDFRLSGYPEGCSAAGCDSGGCGSG